MPLPKSCSMATFYKSVEAEKAAGKPLRQALAIAYSHLKKACGVSDDFSGTPSEIVHKGGGSSEGLGEELWPSVAGANEVRKFYHKADEATIKKFEELYAGGKLIEAIRIMEKVLGIEFAPFASNVITTFLEWYAAKPKTESKVVARLRRIRQELESRPIREFVKDASTIDPDVAEVISTLYSACLAAMVDLGDDELYAAHKQTYNTLDAAVKQAKPLADQLKKGIHPWKPGR